MRAVSQESCSLGEIKGHGSVPLCKDVRPLLNLSNGKHMFLNALQTTESVKMRCMIFPRPRRSFCTSPDDV